MLIYIQRAHFSRIASHTRLNFRLFSLLWNNIIVHLHIMYIDLLSGVLCYHSFRILSTKDSCHTFLPAWRVVGTSTRKWSHTTFHCVRGRDEIYLFWLYPFVSISSMLCVCSPLSLLCSFSLLKHLPEVILALLLATGEHNTKKLGKGSAVKIKRMSRFDMTLESL